VKELQKEATEIIFNKLLQVSQRKSLITYYELNKYLPKMGSKNFLNPFQPLFNVLNDLNDWLSDEEKPLITSLVINRKTGLPGKGFFFYASKLGRYDQDLDDLSLRKEFWEQETKKVYEFKWILEERQ